MAEIKLAGINLNEEKNKSNDEVSLITLDESSANTIFNILKLPEVENKEDNDKK